MTDYKIMNSQKIGFSDLTDDEIINDEKAYGAHHYGRLNLVVREAKGCWLTALDGKKYLDCLAAYSAANPGHHHPKIVAALVDALEGNYASVISNVVYTDVLQTLVLFCGFGFLIHTALRDSGSGQVAAASWHSLRSCVHRVSQA